MYKMDMLAKLKANKANSTIIPIQFDGVDSYQNEKKKKKVWLTLSANVLSLNESLRQSSIHLDKIRPF
jgi:2'-5' RNA ligase